MGCGGLATVRFALAGRVSFACILLVSPTKILKEFLSFS
jgi:hypothetical protein